MAYNKKQFDIAINFAANMQDENLTNQITNIAKKIEKAQKKLRINVTDEDALSDLRNYTNQWNTLMSVISDSSNRLNELKKRFDAVGASMPNFSKNMGFEKFISNSEKAISKIEELIQKSKELDMVTPSFNDDESLNKQIKNLQQSVQLQEKINSSITDYTERFKEYNAVMPNYDQSKTLKQNEQQWENNLRKLQRFRESYELLQRAIGDTVQISMPDASFNKISQQIAQWKSEISDLSNVNIRSDGWKVYEVEVTRALTGLGQEISTFNNSIEGGVSKVQKLSAAGKELAQTYINLSKTNPESWFAQYFKGLDLSDEAGVLKGFSDMIASARITAYDDDLGRETLKLNLFDGVKEQIDEGNSILKIFEDRLKEFKSVTLDEAQDIAKGLGMKLNLGDVMTDEAGEFHQAFELMMGDIKALGSLKSYTDEATGIKGITVASSTTIAKDEQIYREYISLKKDNLQLTKEIQKAEQDEDTALQRFYQNKIDANNQRINDIKEEINATKQLTEAEADLEQLRNRINTRFNEIDNDFAQQELEFNLTHQNQADTAQINKLIQLYQELNQAKLNAYAVDKNVKSTTEEKAYATEKVKKAEEAYNNALKQTNPELLKRKKYTDAITDSNNKLEDSMSKVNSKTKESQSLFGSLGSKITEVAKNVVQYQLAWEALNLVGRGISESISLVHELDTAMTNMRMVTGQTAEEAHEAINTYADLAKQLGVTTRSVAEGSIEWLRQGYSIEESAEMLESSTKLSTLGMLDSAEATELMTSTLNGFNLTAKESESVVDKLVKVD